MRFIQILFLATLAFSAARGQEQINNLEALLQYADAHSTEAKQAQLLPQVAKQDVNIQTSGLYPRINVFSTADYYPIIPSMVVPASLVGGPTDSYTPVQFGLPYVFVAGAELSIPVVDLEKWAQLKRAKTQYQQSQWSSKASMERLHIQVVQQYYQLLVAKDLAKLNEENLETVTELVRIMADRKEAGILEPAEYNRSLNLKLNTETSGIDYAKNIRQAANALYATLGIKDKKQADIAGSLSDFNWPLLEARTYIGSRPAWQEAEMKIKSSELALAESKRGGLPKLNLNSRYAYNMQSKLESGSSGVEFETANIGLRLDIPVFRGNYYRSLQKKNSWQLESARLEKEKVEVTLSQQHEDWFNQYSSAFAKRAVIEQKVKNASDNLRIARLNVKEGLMEFDEFNNIFIEYNRAKMEYLQNLADGVLYHLLSTQNF